MDPDVDWTKLARFLSGECSEIERQEIEERIKTDSDFARLVAETTRAQRMSGSPSGAPGFQKESWDTASAWARVKRRIQLDGSHGAGESFQKNGDSPAVAEPGNGHARPSGKLIYRIAALVVLTLGIAAATLYVHERMDHRAGPMAMREISARNGERVTVRFSDGTKVTLNGGSVLRLPDKFEATRREVFLQGEAFFEVAPMHGIPFVVEVDHASIEVLGTEFAVREWPEDNEVRLTVAQGRVAFRPRNGERIEEGVVLGRGQVSTLSGGRILLSTPASLDGELAWLEGRLVFEKTDFEEVLRALKRRYGLAGSVSDSTILTRKLTATFADEPVREVLKIISLALNLDYRQAQNTIVFLKHRKKFQQKE